MNIFDVQNSKDFKKVEKKASGIETGGIYEKDNIKYMIKNLSPSDVAAEYIGANLVNLLFLPNQAPEVYLVKNKFMYSTASKFLNNFKTLKEGVNEGIIPNQIEEVEERNVIARFLAHSDEHDGNFGFIDVEGIKKAAVVDFSLSLRFFSETILYSTEKKSAIKIDLTTKYINALKKVGQLNVLELHNTIDKLFKTYDSDFKGFGSLTAEDIKNSLEKRIELCKKESLIGDFLINILYNNKLAADTLWPWIKNSGLFEELHKYAPIMLKDLVVSNNEESFDLLMPYLSFSPELMEKEFTKLMIEGKDNFMEKMAPYMNCAFLKTVPGEKYYCSEEISSTFEHPIELIRDTLYNEE